MPWKQGKGYAKLALEALLPDANNEGLAYVEITTDPSNLAWQRVIVANGGVLIERYIKPAEYGGSEGLRFRIHLR